MNELVQLKNEEGIAVVRLNRPEAANAMSTPVLDRLLELFEGLGANTAVRGIVITGEGKHFCVGADIGEAPARFHREMRILHEHIGDFL